jgi:branched-chain amino acid transport system ATP-binding protein
LVDALVLRNVNTLYEDSHVLHDLSLTLRAGHVLALLGRNGVGKTTCIHTIIGFVAPRDGEIELFGASIAHLAPERIVAQGVGLVPQGRRIFPTLTTLENLLIAYRRRGGGSSGWTTERVFDTFPRLRERRDNLAGQLSGGEQQMLAIGRALVTNPRILLLDEPSEGLAPQIVEELRDVLVRLRREGLSMILVEQSSRMALEVADDVVVLTPTQVSFEGSADEARSRQAFLDEQLGVF